MKVAYTHKGWIFGVVPVYVSGLGEGTNVRPRRRIPDWWFHMWHEVYLVVADIAWVMNPHFVPQYAIKITGKLEPPLVFDESDSDRHPDGINAG